MLELSISTGSFYPKPTKYAVRRAKKLGFSSIEITLQDSDLGYDFQRKVNWNLYKDLSKIIIASGLRVASLHAPFLSGEKVFSSRVRNDLLLKSIEIVSLFQANELVIHPYHFLTSYERLCRFLQSNSSNLRSSLIPHVDQFFKAANDRGVTLAMENIADWYDNPLLNDPRNMKKLLTALDEEEMKIDLDIFHSELGGSTKWFLEELGDQIVSVHVCDHTKLKRRTLPGKGRADWHAIGRRIRPLPGLRHVIMELANEFGDREISASAKFLGRTLLGSSVS